MVGVKTNPAPTNGPQAAAQFDALVRKVLSVPHSEILRREAEYKRQSLANPRRRGPKPKVNPSA
jgi:hypothetical protein